MAYSNYHGMDEGGAHLFSDPESGASLRAVGPAADAHAESLAKRSPAAFQAGERIADERMASGGGDQARIQGALFGDPSQQAPAQAPSRADHSGPTGEALVNRIVSGQAQLPPSPPPMPPAAARAD